MQAHRPPGFVLAAHMMHMDASELQQTSNEKKKVMSHTHTYFNRVSVFRFIEGMRIACMVHVRFSFGWLVHVRFMYHPGMTQLWLIGSHVVHVWFTCGSHVVHRWFNIGLEVVHVRFTVGSHVVQYWFTCGSRVVHMWFNIGS